MRRILALSVLVIGVVAIVNLRRPAARSAAAAPESSGTTEVSRPVTVPARTDSILRVRAEILRRIAASGSYLPDMLRQSDSILKRWPDRTTTPLVVYMPPGGAPGYTPELGQAVRRAFDRWVRVAGVPVVFSYSRDSSRADVVVRWISEFPFERTGQAEVRWNRAGWLLSGTLTMATHNRGGIRLSPDAIYTVALHEIGHLLGLGHSDDPADVMYPTTEVRADITVRDRQTARLLYQLPPGSLRTARQP